MGETLSANKPRRSTRASPSSSGINDSANQPNKQTAHTRKSPHHTKTSTAKRGPKGRVQKRKIIESSSSDNDEDDDHNNSDYNNNNNSNFPPTHIDGLEDEVGNVPTAMLAKYAGTTSIASYPPLVAHHRELFMQRAFGQSDAQDEYVDIDDNEMKKSSLRTEDELQNICFILKHWGGNQNLKLLKDDLLRKKLIQFRRAHPVGKHHITKYHYSTITLPCGTKRNILRRIERGKIGRIVVSRERVFDAINEWHRSGSGHFGSERTWMLCKEKYHNCTQPLVRLFCELCPECFQKNPKVKTMKGSRKPIKSKLFRERFQIDLIDMRKLRKRNPYGVLMRWIITIKDHATGYTMIDCIPRKSARFVAHVLQLFFGLVGYPFVFHTDNGKEFVGKEILKCLRHLNPNILTVTGRPRVPRDQGSVESMNKTVKRVMQAELAERRMLGDNPNWTEILGSIASAINSQCGRGKYEVPSYTAVFGTSYHQEVDVTKEEARMCWTLPERLQVRFIFVSELTLSLHMTTLTLFWLLLLQVVNRRRFQYSCKKGFLR
jgi:hypothetical protein